MRSYPWQVNTETETWVVEVVSRMLWVGGLGNTGARLSGSKEECCFDINRENIWTSLIDHLTDPWKGYFCHRVTQNPGHGESEKSKTP